MATLTGWDECKVKGHDLDGVQFANPRLKDICPRCGRKVASTDEPRDLAHERLLTLEASQYSRIGASERAAISEALSSYAEQRAGDGPWRDFRGRSFDVDALEEIADLRMYLLAEFRKHELRNENHEDADAELMHLRRALSAAVEAFGAVMDYRRVRAEA